MIRRLLIDRQSHKPFGWQVLIQINLRLSFGEIIQVADQQAPEQECRVIGWSSCQSFAFMEFVQLFGVISSVDQIIGSVEGFGGCFSTESIALASQGQDSKRVL